jgi:nucleoside-diphosphate-sugar epimerase
MKILITGGGGFLGARLARTILSKGQLNGKSISAVMLADQHVPPEDLVAHSKVHVRTGPLLEQVVDLAAWQPDAVFHLASAVSGECEDDFDLGLRSNIDSTRALLDAFRHAKHVPRFVFSSSVAVYGPDPGHHWPGVVSDETLPTPQTSYGIHKLICEHLVSDYTRKGYIDGRSARLMTVTVRPGRPNGAASSFFSGIIREPLAGEASICPVDASVSHPVASPGKTVEGLIAVFEATREAFQGRTAMNLPGLNVTVAQMLDALEAVAGPEVRSRVRFERNEQIASIVANWSQGATAQRAAHLGLLPDPDFQTIIRQYMADCELAGLGASALKGLRR